MTEIKISDLWAAGGVLLGFQVAAFAWRVAHEVEVAEENRPSWIPPADYLNLLSMVVTALSVFVLPVLGIVAVELAARLLGFAALAFVGHSFALAGHYELFNPRTQRSKDYFPRQERVALLIVGLFLLSFLVLAFTVYAEPSSTQNNSREPPQTVAPQVQHLREDREATGRGERPNQAPQRTADASAEDHLRWAAIGEKRT